ncbi:MAG: hypothetical protein ACKOWG_14625 [Planctomycetia bacterium]
MRSKLLAVAALAFLRIVVGMHFFLEGLSHLRDPEWSSAGFRKAAVGPLADFYRGSLPETGSWSKTLGKADGRPAAEVAAEWKASVVADWKKQLADREKILPLDAAGRASAQERLTAASAELDDLVAGLGDDLSAYRLEIERLATMERSRAAAQIPFARERVAKKRRELAGQAAGWMKDADAIGTKLVAEWDEPRSPAERLRLAASAGQTPLWKADRFVSWSLVTIGACLVLGVLVKFNAMGGVCFLASVIASQPFWVPGAQATYNQWVEVAALLALASLPTGGWSGLDFFLGRWLGNFCPLAGCCRTESRD